MAKHELLDEHVSVNQCKKAIKALHTHETAKEKERQETELLPGKDQNIWLNVIVKQMPSQQKIKPAKIPVVHPLIDPRTTPICLITKDPQREYKDLLETHKIKFISRVVGLEKLKGKFRPFEARRMLLKENGLFLADERVIPLLPKLLGVKWFEAKKQPIPVSMTRKNLKAELERAVSSTYMNQNKGTCTSIKISTLSHTPTQIFENIKMGLPAIVKHIKDGWDNIQSLQIKTNSSMSLPIWNCNLDDEDEGRWNGLNQEQADSEEGSEEEDSAKENEAVKVATVQGKKRTIDGPEAEGTPKKKAKGAKGKAVVSPTPEVISTPETKRNKASSRTAASTSHPSVPASTASPNADGKIKRKKQRRDPEISTSAPEISTESDTVETSNVDVSTKKKGKKKGGTATSIPPPAPVDQTIPTKEEKGITRAEAPQKAVKSLTSSELKQKRVADIGEKKKSRLITAKPSKSAKNQVIGKKAARG